MEFKKEGAVLLLLYMPEIGADDVRKKLDEDNLHLKNCFHLARKNEYTPQSVDKFEYDFCFKVGALVDGYYCLDKEIFATKHTFYIDASINIKQQHFLAYRNISILSKIDHLVSTDVYITDGDVLSPGHLPFSEFTALIKAFPNSTELTKYTYSRISQILSNYFDGLGDVTTNYEQYLNKKATVADSPIRSSALISLELFCDAYRELSNMLNNAEAYVERDWQLAVCNIVRILYPKYILAKREQKIGNDGRNDKQPDFLLVDASGFVDILEIKKPNHQRLLTSSKYRNNYIADRDLSGAIVQVEKYIYTLNHGGTNLESQLQKRLSDELPAEVTIRVTNPQGMLLMGRSNNLTDDQKFDLEIIKRQHKNIVDIMTYDDLLDRIKNILTQIEKSIPSKAVL